MYISSIAVVDLFSSWCCTGTMKVGNLICYFDWPMIWYGGKRNPQHFLWKWKRKHIQQIECVQVQYICRLVASYMLRQSNYDVPCPHFDIIFTVFNIDLCLYSGRTSKQRHKKISCEKIFLKWKAVSRRRAEEKKSTEETFCVHILAVIVITQYYIWNKAMREVTFCGGVISVLSLVVATAFSSWAQVFFHNFVHNHQDSFRYNVFFSNHQDSNSMSTVKMISKLLLVCNGYEHLK